MRQPLAAACALALCTAPVFAASAPAPLSPQDAGAVAIAYQHMMQDFYKNVKSQDVLNGARTGLRTALTLSHITSRPLPPMIASGNPRAAIIAVDREIELAARNARNKIAERDLTYAAISGMMASVHDPYTVFLSPSDLSGFNGDLNGSDFGGTGIVIEADDAGKYISVTTIVPGGPADKANVRQGDVILSIDGTPTKGMSLNAASAHLRGKAGTPVTLEIQRDGARLPAPITLTRATIHQLSVLQKMLPGKVGYVALSVFGRDTGSELSAALDHLQKDGARAFIMDLRENGGGFLSAALAVSSKFIPIGPIVSIESRSTSITTLEADDTAMTPRPLVVLVNGHTASASEITSGAIQDDGAGVLIGTRTFGKGVVQSVYSLPDGGAIKITTARYLTPHNRDINHRGIDPDIVVQENKDARLGDPAHDAQLARALAYLGTR